MRKSTKAWLTIAIVSGALLVPLGGAVAQASTRAMAAMAFPRPHSGYMLGAAHKAAVNYERVTESDGLVGRCFWMDAKMIGCLVKGPTLVIGSQQEQYIRWIDLVHADVRPSVDDVY